MTTTVNIEHYGPNSHDILVTPSGSTSLHAPTRLREGVTLTAYVYGDGKLTITEIPKEEQE